MVRNDHRFECGTAVVELAIGLFVLLLLLTGFSALNSTISEQVLIVEATRSGARAGALSQTPVTTARAITEQLLQLYNLEPTGYAINIRTLPVVLPNLGAQQILQVAVSKITEHSTGRNEYGRCIQSSYYVENGESEADYMSPDSVCFD